MQQDKPLPTTEQMVRSLALLTRDKALADARQAMKLVRQIERDYGLLPANTKGEKHGGA